MYIHCKYRSRIIHGTCTCIEKCKLYAIIFFWGGGGTGNKEGQYDTYSMSHSMVTFKSTAD